LPYLAGRIITSLGPQVKNISRPPRSFLLHRLEKGDVRRQVGVTRKLMGGGKALFSPDIWLGENSIPNPVEQVKRFIMHICGKIFVD